MVPLSVVDVLLLSVVDVLLLFVVDVVLLSVVYVVPLSKVLWSQLSHTYHPHLELMKSTVSLQAEVLHTLLPLLILGRPLRLLTSAKSPSLLLRSTQLREFDPSTRQRTSCWRPTIMSSPAAVVPTDDAGLLNPSTSYNAIDKYGHPSRSYSPSFSQLSSY